MLKDWKSRIFLTIVVTGGLVLPLAFTITGWWTWQELYATIFVGILVLLLDKVVRDQEKAVQMQRDQAEESFQDQLRASANLELQEKVGCFEGKAAEIETAEVYVVPAMYLLSDAAAAVNLYRYGADEQRRRFRRSLKGALESLRARWNGHPDHGDLGRPGLRDLFVTSVDYLVGQVDACVAWVTGEAAEEWSDEVSELSALRELLKSSAGGAAQVPGAPAASIHEIAVALGQPEPGA